MYRTVIEGVNTKLLWENLSVQLHTFHPKVLTDSPPFVVLLTIYPKRFASLIIEQTGTEPTPVQLTVDAKCQRDSKMVMRWLNPWLNATYAVELQHA